MNRIRIVILVVSLVGTLLPAVPASAHAESSVTFFGGGFGHAVGMSQYGALSMAEDGKTSSEILAFYYTGTSVADHTALAGVVAPIAESNPNIWVGLDQSTTTMTFTVPVDAGGPVDLCQADDGQGACPRTDAVPQPGETWEFGKVASTADRCEFRRISPNPQSYVDGACRASITWGAETLASYVDVNGVDYEHGTLRIRQGQAQAGTGKFHVALELGIEDYLLGLREVPLHWPAAALEAQVIAGRTYALEKFNRFWVNDLDDPVKPIEENQPDRRSSCYCHVYDSILDQNYRGMENEQLNAADYPDWEAAVVATAGTVATHGGKLIQAFYSSSTGGYTENSEDVFITALPYAKSVADPWSAHSTNPLVSWEKVVSFETIASVYGFVDVTSVSLASPAPDAMLTITGNKNGSLVTETHGLARKYGALGLLSPSVNAIGASDFAFIDIATSIHADDINEIAERGITLGCNPPDNTLFCPLDTVTRGQMAAFLTRALVLPPTDEDFFADDETSIFEDDINRLVAVAGTDLACSDGNFCANDAIRRDEMALFLERALDLQPTGATDFVDVVDNEYRAEINTIGDYGITLGCNPPDNDRFCPDRSVLRQEMASFLVRAIAQTGG